MALLAIVFMAGCSPSPDHAKELDTLRSWTGTVRLTTQEHKAGAIPNKQAMQINIQASAALAKARTALQNDTASDTRAAIDSLSHAIGDLNAETYAR